MTKPHIVHVMPCDLMPFMVSTLITTWSSTATTYISMMAHTHPLRLDRSKTKSSHLLKKSRHRFAWLCGHGLPETHSLPYQSPILMNFGIVLFNPTTTHNNHITHKDISRFKRLFPEAVFHNEDKRATSLRIYCPVLYFQCLTTTFADPLVFRKLEQSPSDIIERTIAEINCQFGKAYPWALGSGRDLPNAYVLPKRKKQFKAG